MDFSSMTPLQKIDHRMQHAIRAGNTNAVQRMIESYGLSHCEAWSDGYSLLRSAIKYNRSQIIELLLNLNCKFNDENSQSDTFLHLAVLQGDAAIISTLLNKGVDVNARGKEKRTALHLAVRLNNISVVKLLLERGASVDALDENGATPLFYLLSNNASRVESIFDEIAGKRMKVESSKAEANSTEFGNEVLPSVEPQSNENRYEIVKLLLDSNADVNKISCGISPIFVCAEMNYEELFDLLVTFGAEIDFSMTKGCKTILHYAVINGSLKIVQYLLQHRNFDADPFYFLISDAVATNGPNTIRIIECLLYKGVAIDSYALLYAIDKRKKEIVKTLVQWGPRTFLHFGVMYFIKAVRMEDEGMVEMLLKSGAFSYSNEAFMTRLYLSSVRYNYNIFQLLLNVGLGLNMSNDSFLTVMVFMESNWRQASEYRKNLVKRKLFQEKIVMVLAAKSIPNEHENCRTELVSDEFRESCKKEIEKMKQKGIANNSDATVFDFLTGTPNQVVPYLRGANFEASNIHRIDFWKKNYPIYAEVLWNKVVIAISKMTVLNEFEEMFFNAFPQIPLVCSQKIISFLNLEVIRGIVTSSKFPVTRLTQST